MQYVIFDENGLPVTAINDESITELPDGAHEIDDSQFKRWFDLRLVDNNISILEAEPPQTTQQEQAFKDIKMLEAQQTTRRIREAVLGIDGGWLANLNTQIAALRAQLS